MIAACTERFERRLVEEVAGLRVQIAQTEALLRRDMAQMGADIREETAQMGASIRQEIAQMGAGIRQEIATGRVATLKWCFLFWIGQSCRTSTTIPRGSGRMRSSRRSSRGSEAMGR